ncbi:hypothetical protein HDA35_003944 [Micromonospora purpureochromogenes]|uniref:Uncharacterized protein n=1 Tax=Micromonospora purpureochromogenes TaxID=47872 RepID=A0ABX2RNM6_9ACTN|nr:hypothetical protein [Micromonospora purpureochromogenes]
MSSSPVCPIFIATDHAAAFAPLINPERCERSSNVTNGYLIRQLIVHFSLIGDGGIPAFAQVRSAPAGPQPPGAHLRRRPVVTRQRLCDLAVTYPDRSGRLDDPDERPSPRRPSGPSSPPNGDPRRDVGTTRRPVLTLVRARRPGRFPTGFPGPHSADPAGSGGAEDPGRPILVAARRSGGPRDAARWTAGDERLTAGGSPGRPDGAARTRAPLCGLSRCPRRPLPRHAANRAAPGTAPRQRALRQAAGTALRQRRSGAPDEVVGRAAGANRTSCSDSVSPHPRSPSRPTPATSPRAAERPAPHRGAGRA